MDTGLPLRKRRHEPLTLPTVRVHPIIRVLALHSGRERVDIAPRLSVVKVSEPKKREAGEKVADVDTLIAKLKSVGAI